MAVVYYRDPTTGTPVPLLAPEEVAVRNDTPPTDVDLWVDLDEPDPAPTLAAQDVFIPIGTVQVWAGAAAPNAYWMICNGAAVSRSTYAALYGVVGVTYGVGDGSTTFNLPNLKGRVVVSGIPRPLWDCYQEDET